MNITSHTRWISGLLIALVIMAAGAFYYFNLMSNASLSPANVDVDTSMVRQGPPSATVLTAEAITFTFAPYMELPGTVQSVVDAVIASETRGKITSVAMVGDEVRKGQTIANIDPTDARENLEQRRAELQRLESQLSYHTEYYATITQEDDQLGFSGISVAELKSNMDSAKADLERGKVAVRLAETDLERTTVRAPFAGTIVRQEIQPGEYAQVGSPVARLVNTDRLEVSVQVPSASVMDIAEDTVLPVTGKRSTREGRFRALVPVGHAVSRTMELRADISGSSFLVGEPVRVRIPVSEPKTAIAVPRDAIVLRSNEAYLFVVTDGVAVRRTVDKGLSQGDMVEVTGNVQLGERVVIRGAERLRDGQPVILNSPVTPPSPTGNTD